MNLKCRGQDCKEEGTKRRPLSEGLCRNCWDKAQKYVAIVEGVCSPPYAMYASAWDIAISSGKVAQVKPST